LELLLELEGKSYIFEINLLIVACLFILLFLRIVLFYSSVEKYTPGQIISWQTKALTQTKLSVQGQQLSLSMPNSQRVLLNLKLMPQASHGDTLMIKGKVEYVKVVDGDLVSAMN